VEIENVRWPLVHSEDLTTLYALTLEKAPARSISGAAIDRLASRPPISPETLVNQPWTFATPGSRFE
jgi:hypothetical protein